MTSVVQSTIVLIGPQRVMKGWAEQEITTEIKTRTTASKVGIYCIGVGRFRILGGPRFRILGGPRGGQIPSRHMSS